MSNFEFSPYITSLPRDDEACYEVRWHPDGRTPFKAWVRGQIIYLLEMGWTGEPVFGYSRKKSYVAHMKYDGVHWMYYDNDSTRAYYPNLEITDNPTMVADMDKILIEHQLQRAMESALNSNRN